MFLSHLPFLFFCLHYASLCSEVLEAAIEETVFAELTFQRTVVERHFEAWLQSYLFKTFLAITENPCLIILEVLLQFVAKHLIESEQVWSRDTLSGWWVCHHDSLLRMSFEVIEVSLLDAYLIGKTSCTHIDSGCIDCLHVNVVAIDGMLKLAFL